MLHRRKCIQSRRNQRHAIHSNYTVNISQGHHHPNQLLSEALKRHPSLTSLGLSGNIISNEETFKISEALKSTTSLTSLDLSCNTCCFNSFSLNTVYEIGKEGAIKLAEALTSTTSLTSLDLSRNRFRCVLTTQPGTDNKIGNRQMMKMKNFQDKLPTDLLAPNVLTRWAPSTHSQFPLKFRQVVKAVLMLGAKRQDGTPCYPQTHFYKLPKDVLFLILDYTYQAIEFEKYILVL